MDNDHKNLSVRLTEVLDAVGASEKERWQSRETHLAIELPRHALSTLFDNDIENFTFGSQVEGSSTPGLKSDFDCVQVSKKYIIRERLGDEPLTNASLLLVTDESTTPGYVKLQSVLGGIPQTIRNSTVDTETEEIDQLGRICLEHICVGEIVMAVFHNYKGRNGPAHTFFADDLEFDIVPALSMSTIPSMARGWIYRTRATDWPTQKQLQNMATFECLFVGVAHPKSPNKSIEWRISFSLQERELMTSLNPTQHKCYILLKMIKKDIIETKVGESISSYHCKTCLFYTIENTERSFWIPQNLIEATRLCISRMLGWTKENNCPNYFIPEANMFDKLEHDVVAEVAVVLEEVLTSGTGFLSMISCDNVDVLLSINANLSDVRNRYRLKHNFNMRLIVANYGIRRSLFTDIPHTSSAEEFLKDLNSLQHHLQHTDIVKYYTRDEVRRTLGRIQPYVYLQQALCTAARLFKNKVPLSPLFHHLVEKGQDCDTVSSRLVLATCYFQYDQLESCERILKACSGCMNPHVYSLCKCGDKDNHLKLGQKLPFNINASFKDFVQEYIAMCMYFHPSQACLVHKALHFEMFRSVFASEQENICRPKWFDWIVVDSKVFLYFLQYILYSKLNNDNGKKVAITKLLQLLVDFERHISHHRETLLNLLGWIFLQEDQVDIGLWCFLQSWRLMPDHNAAKWHLALYYYKLSLIK